MARSDSRKEAAERKKEIFKQRQEMSIEVAKIDAGIDYIRYIRDICGFEISSVNINPISGEISERNTVYNEARRSVYLELRKYLPKKLLAKIELGDKK